MNKILIFTVCVLLNFCSTIYAFNLIEVRDLFYRSSLSSKSADSLVSLLNQEKNLSAPELIGYKGMAELMVCYHSYNPYTKLSYFYSGKALLEKAVSSHPENIELRFLRLTVQLNVPSILMYSSNIAEDKKAIFEGIKHLKDKDLADRIFYFTMNAKKISDDEKKLVIEALKENKLFLQK